MTYETFLAKLRETPRDWEISFEGVIRRGQRCCPITSLTGRSATHWKLTAIELGMSEVLAEKIVEAADCDAGHNPIVRRDLLAACGLSQPPDPLVTRAT
jgi:hypothetical protein